jgi:hypothetical protein
MGRVRSVSAEAWRDSGAGEVLRRGTDERRKRGDERRLKKGLYRNRVKQRAVGWRNRVVRIDLLETRVKRYFY